MCEGKDCNTCPELEMCSTEDPKYNDWMSEFDLEGMDDEDEM